MTDWHNRFLRIAEEVASWSKDNSKKVGAVIVDKNNRILSVGFNGFARGVKDSSELYADKEYKNQVILHAETNAIMFAKESLEGATIYTSFPTCGHCASQIIQSGIKQVIHKKFIKPSSWSKSIKIAKKLYREAGVEYLELENSYE